MSNDRVFTRYFAKSATLVQDACSQFERDYARPVYRDLKLYFKERPIISTFVTIFTLLSLIPIALFAGTSVFFFLSLTVSSLILAFLAAFSVILALFAALSLVLFGTLLVSIFLTGATLSSYALLRLALHIQREGPSAGVSEWGKETKHAFIARKQPAPVSDRNLIPENVTTASAPATTEEEQGSWKDQKSNVKSKNGPGFSDLAGEAWVKKFGEQDDEKKPEAVRHYAPPITRYNDDDVGPLQGHQ
ncbi:hypothetical protein P691DRAFT_771481 [Macrolepiota fuliginosa MF-IS2]|uniref:Uncharacterized protein n=1 Tax=Macrolepiota fuliginosa MF-IS2 TaxID=1400762 RepID=A0A9P5XM10_9AGAR|nr:hypothetical protein P691DRAFT_771481 [Macrolepiota fuliginosa MF-IS2]